MCYILKLILICAGYSCAADLIFLLYNSAADLIFFVYSSAADLFFFLYNSAAGLIFLYNSAAGLIFFLYNNAADVDQSVLLIIFLRRQLQLIKLLCVKHFGQPISVGCD